ncbi:hypothetical protein HDU76_008961 [Blyttiomyces sp. JEL0837]|nr:hypothetical protein HDU76_008961 [Blyttiomyces sp. JEL0837]
MDNEGNYFHQMAALFSTEDYMDVTAVAVHENYKKLGVGEALVKRVCEIAAQHMKTRFDFASDKDEQWFGTKE